MDYSVSLLIHKLALIVFLIVLAVGSFMQNNTVLLVGLVILALDILQYVIFYRCPFCKKHLRHSDDKCLHCGARLR